MRSWGGLGGGDCSPGGAPVSTYPHTRSHFLFQPCPLPFEAKRNQSQAWEEEGPVVRWIHGPGSFHNPRY